MQCAQGDKNRIGSGVDTVGKTAAEFGCELFAEFSLLSAVIAGGFAGDDRLIEKGIDCCFFLFSEVEAFRKCRLDSRSSAVDCKIFHAFLKKLIIEIIWFTASGRSIYTADKFDGAPSFLTVEEEFASV